MRGHSNLYNAIQMQKTTMFLLLSMLIAVAAFNVVSNLVMTVDDNKSQIAILRTLGASPADIRIIFVLHGLFVGVFGVVLGLVVGLVLTSSLSTLFVGVTSFFGLNLMGEYFIRYLPTEVLAADIIYLSAISLAICLIATLYPASKAANARSSRPD